MTFAITAVDLARVPFATTSLCRLLFVPLTLPTADPIAAPPAG